MQVAAESPPDERLEVEDSDAADESTLKSAHIVAESASLVDPGRTQLETTKSDVIPINPSPSPSSPPRTHTPSFSSTSSQRHISALQWGRARASPRPGAVLPPSSKVEFFRPIEPDHSATARAVIVPDNQHELELELESDRSQDLLSAFRVEGAEEADLVGVQHIPKSPMSKRVLTTSSPSIVQAKLNRLQTPRTPLLPVQNNISVNSPQTTTKQTTPRFTFISRTIGRTPASSTYQAEHATSLHKSNSEMSPYVMAHPCRGLATQDSHFVSAVTAAALNSQSVSLAETGPLVQATSYLFESSAQPEKSSPPASIPRPAWVRTRPFHASDPSQRFDQSLSLMENHRQHVLRHVLTSPLNRSFEPQSRAESVASSTTEFDLSAVSQALAFESTSTAEFTPRLELTTLPPTPTAIMSLAGRRAPKPSPSGATHQFLEYKAQARRARAVTTQPKSPMLNLEQSSSQKSFVKQPDQSSRHELFPNLPPHVDLFSIPAAQCNTPLNITAEMGLEFHPHLISDSLGRSDARSAELACIRECVARELFIQQSRNMLELLSRSHRDIQLLDEDDQAFAVDEQARTRTDRAVKSALKTWEFCGTGVGVSATLHELAKLISTGGSRLRIEELKGTMALLTVAAPALSRAMPPTRLRHLLEYMNLGHTKSFQSDSVNGHTGSPSKADNAAFFMTETGTPQRCDSRTSESALLEQPPIIDMLDGEDDDQTLLSRVLRFDDDEAFYEWRRRQRTKRYNATCDSDRRKTQRQAAERRIEQSIFSIIDAVRQLRERAVLVFEAIQAWRVALHSTDRVFTWAGENYFVRMQRDLAFFQSRQWQSIRALVPLPSGFDNPCMLPLVPEIVENGSGEHTLTVSDVKALVQHREEQRQHAERQRAEEEAQRAREHQIQLAAAAADRARRERILKQLHEKRQDPYTAPLVIPAPPRPNFDVPEELDDFKLATAPSRKIEAPPTVLVESSPEVENDISPIDQATADMKLVLESVYPFASAESRTNIESIAQKIMLEQPFDEEKHGKLTWHAAARLRYNGPAPIPEILNTTAAVADSMSHSESENSILSRTQLDFETTAVAQKKVLIDPDTPQLQIGAAKSTVQSAINISRERAATPRKSTSAQDQARMHLVTLPVGGKSAAEIAEDAIIVTSRHHLPPMPQQQHDNSFALSSTTRAKVLRAPLTNIAEAIAHEAHMAQLNRAAFVLTRVCKRFVRRLRQSRLQQQLLKTQQIERASRIITQAVRTYIYRKRSRARWSAKNYHRAAVCIQAAVRGYLARVRIRHIFEERKLQATLCIQAAMRAYLCRRQAVRAIRVMLCSPKQQVELAGTKPGSSVDFTTNFVRRAKTSISSPAPTTQTVADRELVNLLCSAADQRVILDALPAFSVSTPALIAKSENVKSLALSELLEKHSNELNFGPGLDEISAATPANALYAAFTIPLPPPPAPRPPPRPVRATSSNEQTSQPALSRQSSSEGPPLTRQNSAQMPAPPAPSRQLSGGPPPLARQNSSGMPVPGLSRQASSGMPVPNLSRQASAKNTPTLSRQNSVGPKLVRSESLPRALTVALMQSLAVDVPPLDLTLPPKPRVVPVTARASRVKALNSDAGDLINRYGNQQTVVNAARIIQRCWLRYSDRLHEARTAAEQWKQMFAAIRIQAAWRGYRARKLIAPMKKKAKEARRSKLLAQQQAMQARGSVVSQPRTRRQSISVAAPVAPPPRRQPMASLREDSGSGGESSSFGRRAGSFSQRNALSAVAETTAIIPEGNVAVDSLMAMLSGGQ